MPLEFICTLEIWPTSLWLIAAVAFVADVDVVPPAAAVPLALLLVELVLAFIVELEFVVAFPAALVPFVVCAFASSPLSWLPASVTPPITKAATSAAITAGA